ncbi:MAG: phage tail protein I [Desulfurellales bacterium]|nr:MAG: phage tail protein I [Desulfurellales bacterium]
MILDIPLPQSSGRAEKALAVGLLAASDIPVPLSDLWNPATCPTVALPWLAWALSVDDWDANWPEAIKRQVVSNSIMIHRRKGTVWAIKQQLAAMGYGQCEYTEHWQTVVGAPWVVGDRTPVGWQSLVGGKWIVGDATPVGGNHWAEYWVKVLTPITPEMVQQIARHLDLVAPARCHLTKITVDAVAVVVGADWPVGDPAVTVGATYPLEIL